MHHAEVSENYRWLPHNVDPSIETPEEHKGIVIQPLGDVQKRYDDFLRGCFEEYNKTGKGDICYDTEDERVAMTLRQPRSMYNYTTVGYTKMRLPSEVFASIKSFWESNRLLNTTESWPEGYTYTNHASNQWSLSIAMCVRLANFLSLSF
jgi:prolyl 4-hydroxylase